MQSGPLFLLRFDHCEYMQALHVQADVLQVSRHQQTRSVQIAVHFACTVQDMQHVCQRVQERQQLAKASLMLSPLLQRHATLQHLQHAETCVQNCALPHACKCLVLLFAVYSVKALDM
jgi:hypothetical protein